MPSALFGQLQSNAVDVNKDGIPDLMERYAYFGGGTSSSVEVHRAIYPDNDLLTSSGNTQLSLGTSIDENLKLASFPSIAVSGYYAIRFRAADGLHYGWFRASQPQLPGGGFFPNFIGVTVAGFGYNLIPDAPFTVGTPTSAVPVPIPIVLSASLVDGRLRLSWNGNAAPSGVLVESRVLHPDARWVFLRTVSSGGQVDIEPGGEGRMYRVVKI